LGKIDRQEATGNAKHEVDFFLEQKLYTTVKIDGEKKWGW
jgi:hypothetical protein